MFKLMFSIFDSKANCFTCPQPARSQGEAVRIFSDEANNPKSVISQHPEDFSLILVGEFNEQTGVFTPVNHTNLGNASGYKNLSKACIASVNPLPEGLGF